MTRTANRTVIVYGHPYEESFNHAVLEAVTDSLTKRDRPFDVIDLHADEFDPRYTVEELALFSKGQTLDPLVTRYQELLESADRLIFIFPIWWDDAPAVVKGFIDKVMKQKWAYVTAPTGLKGRLTHIREALVLTTSTAPTWYLKRRAGNVIGGGLVGTVLRQLGIRKRHWVNFGGITGSRKGKRAKHLRKVAALVR